MKIPEDGVLGLLLFSVLLISALHKTDVSRGFEAKSSAILSACANNPVSIVNLCEKCSLSAFERNVG